MKKVIHSLILLILIITITGCNYNKENNIENNKNNSLEDSSNNNEANNSYKENKTVRTIINEKEYIINLEANEASKKFVKILPQELKMYELNGNEKYAYLDYILPSNPTNPQKINTGDVMLYGDTCLVIFYKSFDTSYNYTKIGHINNLPNLGNGNITIKFEK